MRLLLDECVPKALRRELTGHESRTVQEMGWAGVKNGALLRLAMETFDAFITVDQGIKFQQDLTGLTIRVVVLLGASNDIDDLRPLVPGALRALSVIQPSQVIQVGPERT
jgi:hypothetical protein